MPCYSGLSWNVPPPLAIQVHPRDNVAIAAAPEGLLRAELIPQGHKVALRDFEKGDAILRYGHAIGYAARAIRRGAWVREEFVEAPEPPRARRTAARHRDAGARCRRSRATPSRATAMRTAARARSNLLAIATTVQCVAPTVEYAVRRIQAEILPRFPQRGRRGGHHAHLRLRRGHRRARRRRPHPHPAPHQPARQRRAARPWW